MNLYLFFFMMFDIKTDLTWIIHKKEEKLIEFKDIERL